MKLIINQDSSQEENEIIINCNYMDERLQKLAEYIRQFTFCLTGYSEEGMSQIPIEKICYIESIDNRTFLYLEKEVYQSRESLSNLEMQLKNTPFIRISKSCLLNVSYLKSVKALMNHRMEATLKNGEKVMISRTYIKDLKEKMEGKK